MPPKAQLAYTPHIMRTLLATLVTLLLLTPSAASAATAQDAEAFLHDWFAMLDRAEKVETLLPHIAEKGFEMDVLGRPVRSRDEFKGWYAGMLQSFSRQSHEIQEVKVTPGEAGSFRLNFRLRWQATAAQGQQYDQVYDEVWLLKSEDGRWVIYEYRILPPSGH